MGNALTSLREPASQRAVLAERLLAHTDEALDALDALVRHAFRGDAEARTVLLSLARLRAERADLAFDAWAARAEERGLAAAAVVLARGSAARALPTGARLAEPQAMEIAARRLVFRAHDQTSDAALARARWRSSPLRPRLLRDPRGSVARSVLAATTTPLRDVLQLASRRPSRDELVFAVVTSRWLSELAVREALVRNPYTPRWLALTLAGTIPRSAFADEPRVCAPLRAARLV